MAKAVIIDPAKMMERGAAIGQMMENHASGQNTDKPLQTSVTNSSSLTQNRQRINIPINAVMFPSPIQTREPFDPSNNPDDNELMENIREKGVLQAIWIYPSEDRGVYKIIAGHRRLAASIALGKKTIPADIFPANLTDADKDALTIVENLQRRDLSPLELATVIQSFMKRNGYSLRDAAKRVGKTHSYLSKILGIIDMEDHEKAILSNHSVPTYTAYEISRMEDRERAATLDLVNQGISAKAAISMVKNHNGHENLKPDVITSYNTETSVQENDPDSIVETKVKPAINFHNCDRDVMVTNYLGDEAADRFYEELRDKPGLEDRARLLSILWKLNEKDFSRATDTMNQIPKHLMPIILRLISNVHSLRVILKNEHSRSKRSPELVISQILQELFGYITG